MAACCCTTRREELVLLKEARITPIPKDELFYTDTPWKGYVDLEEPVFASSPLEAIGRLIHQQTGAPLWLIPNPLGTGNAGVATMVQWRATVQPPDEAEPVDVTAYDPLVAAATLLHMIINRETDEQPQEAEAGTFDQGPDASA